MNVNAIAPGYTVTDNTQALRDDPERSRALLERIPAGRFAEPSEIAGAVVFLASDGADFVMAGRAPAFGVGAGGVAGANRALDILELELARALDQPGLSSYRDVGASELAMTSSRR